MSNSPIISPEDDARPTLLKRREFIRKAARGSALVALGGGLWYFSDSGLTREARAQKRPDGRPRLPPGQRVIERLKPMGGQQGDPRKSHWRVKVHGAVDKPFNLTFSDLMKQDVVTQSADVHCVTGWTVIGANFTGVRIADLAKRAGVRGTARYVVFEAAHGYTANVPLADAIAPGSMVTWKLDGRALARPHGAPVRALVPNLYFWKSAKWLTGIKFVTTDEPGYWETRGYHNHADPWKEQRHG
jgi:DMSO/TMAO reductase YedYZ molybdopterin-dependent catalytic subunit